MNELIVNADGTYTVVGDAGSVSGILADLVKAATIPAEYDDDHVETKAAIVPDADTLVIEVIAELITRTVVKTPAVLNDDGTVETPAVYEEEVVPDDRPLLKTHAWRLPKARVERLEDIRGARNARLFELDDEANQALTGRPGVRSVEDVEAARQVLRDLPPTAQRHLAGLNNTDDMASYDPIR